MHARYAPPARTSFGTHRYDANGNLLQGEYNNHTGLPMGTTAPAGPSALSAFKASQPGAATSTAPAPVRPYVAPAFPPKAAPAGDYGMADATRTLAPTSAFATQPLGIAPPRVTTPASRTPAPATAAAPSPSRPSTSAFALPTNPDDRALLAETKARDLAARQPTPISIPGGDPEARAFFGKRSTPEPGASAIDRNVDPRLLAAAGTGQVFKTPWGTVSSSTHEAGAPEGPAVVTNTGVSRAPARLAEAATASPMSVPGYYAATPEAATAAPPQSSVPRATARLGAPWTPEAASAQPPQTPALAPGMPSRTSLIAGPLVAPRRPEAATAAPPQAGSPSGTPFPRPEAASAMPPMPGVSTPARSPLAASAPPPQAANPGSGLNVSTPSNSAFSTKPLSPAPRMPGMPGTFAEPRIPGLPAPTPSPALPGESTEDWKRRTNQASAFPRPRNNAQMLDLPGQMYA